MTTDVLARPLFETLVSTRTTKHTAGLDDGRTFVSIVTERKTAGWDPYEVWLHRIREPRNDRQPNR